MIIYRLFNARKPRNSGSLRFARFCALAQRRAVIVLHVGISRMQSTDKPQSARPLIYACNGR
jgi:hypothetical protein